MAEVSIRNGEHVEQRQMNAGTLREVGRQGALAGFDVVRDIDGSPAEVETDRQDRHPEPQD
jgi:hypothetical protein